MMTDAVWGESIIVDPRFFFLNGSAATVKGGGTVADTNKKYSKMDMSANCIKVMQNIVSFCFVFPPSFLVDLC